MDGGLVLIWIERRVHRRAPGRLLGDDAASAETRLVQRRLGRRVPRRRVWRLSWKSAAACGTLLLLLVPELLLATSVGGEDSRTIVLLLPIGGKKRGARRGGGHAHGRDIRWVGGCGDVRRWLGPGGARRVGVLALHFGGGMPG